MQINDLPFFRYSITEPHNGGVYRLNYGQMTVIPRMTAYSQLIQKHIATLQYETRANSHQQVVRNHLTAIRAFLKFTHKSETSTVGGELADQFEVKLKEHLASCTLSDRSKADRRSMLRAWKSTYDGLASSALAPPPKRERHSAESHSMLQNPFEKKFKHALRTAGLSAKSAAKLAGVSTSAVGRWTRGALPNIRSKETIAKLEAVLKLDANALSDSLDSCWAAQAPSQPNKFRERLKVMRLLEFRLKPNELSLEFLEEWRDFLAYKVAVRPPNGLKRSKRGVWSLAQPEHSTSKPTNLNSTAGLVAHTADMNWSHISPFLGFLRLPKDQGGFGQQLANVQTLSWLCVPDAIEAYLTFASQRSGGLRHDGHRAFCITVISLTREKYGYLRQIPLFLHKLPQEVTSGNTWNFLCDEANATAEAWAATATDSSRNPQDGIAFFLQQKQPLRPIFDAMHRIRRLADGCMPGSISEAVLRRDELLLGFLMSNPLRAINVKTITWKADNSGHVYKSPAGQWRLRISSREFKNRGRGKNKTRNRYDVAIAAWLAPYLASYLECFRPVLSGSDGKNYLFVNSLTGGCMTDLNRRVFAITKRFIPGSAGISPHAFRHLVATVWLEENPNDFFVVAELLNDSLQVVLNNYAHMKKDTSFSKYELFVSAMV